MKNKLLLAALLALLCAASTIICCTKNSNDTEADSLDAIRNRGTLIVGTTGDYRPLSYREPATGEYWGFGIEVAQKIAENIGVKATFVPTSWPTLTEDVLKEPAIFDFAIGGITITDARKSQMDMSDGYLKNGKTILCRKEDAQKYQTLDDLNRPEVRVMINPGGLNEKFARANLPNAKLIVYDKNEEIPSQISENNADVMITEITEAPYYVETDSRLAAPLINRPFTHGEIGILLQKNKTELLTKINSIISQMKADGSLKTIHEKYGVVYGY
jgi:cyclohexadienyl dehydratase